MNNRYTRRYCGQQPNWDDELPIVATFGWSESSPSALLYPPGAEYNPYRSHVFACEEEGVCDEGPSTVEERRPFPRRRRKRRNKRRRRPEPVLVVEGENNEGSSAAPEQGVTVSDQVPVQAPVQAPVQVVPPSAPVAEIYSESYDDVEYDSEGPEESQWEECSEEEDSELEEEVNKAMETPLALMALEAGLEVEQVRHALKERMLYNGMPFESSDDLVMQVLEGRLSGEDSEASVSEQQSSEVPSASYVPEERERIRPRLPLRHATEPLQRTPRLQRVRQCRGRGRGRGASAAESHGDPSDASLSDSDKKARMCVVCMEEEVKTIFLPCRHGVCCSECSRKLYQCPTCRQLIKQRIDVFFS